jgi:hypothetical protein
MSSITINKNNQVTVVKKMKNYSEDPFLKKKAENALAFIKKHGLPRSAKKRNKYPVF